MKVHLIISKSSFLVSTFNVTRFELYLGLKFLEIVVFQGLCRFDPLFWIFYQHFFHQNKSFRVQSFVFGLFEVDLHLLIFLIYFLIFAALKKMLACKKDMKDSSKREYIALWLNMLTLCQTNDLRSNVAGSSTSKVKVLHDIRKGAQPVIDYDWMHRIFVPKHNILRLQISMNDSLRMQKL